jgi:hypothetical protein
MHLKSQKECIAKRREWIMDNARKERLDGHKLMLKR